MSFFLIALGRRAQQAVEARLREYGLAYHHFSALAHLHRQPGLSYSSRPPGTRHRPEHPRGEAGAGSTASR